MSKAWPQVTVETIAAPWPHALSTGPFGSSIGSQTFRNSGTPVIRGGNLSTDVGIRIDDSNLVFIDNALAQTFERSAVVSGDLVFTCWGTINQIGLVSDRATFKKYIISNKQMKLTPDNTKVSSNFLYYWFSSPLGQHEILSKGIGSSVPGFNLGQLRKMHVPLRSLSIQNAIVSVLGALDDKIDLNRRMNGTLEAMARAIFRDWFVEFGPTRAKMDGRPPYLAPDLWALFPDRLDDEGKPEGWTTARLDDAASDIRRGVSPTYVEKGGVRVINQKFIRNWSVNYSLARQHDLAVRDVSDRKILPGDILINSTGVGTLGRTAQVWKLSEDTIVDSHVTIVRPVLRVIFPTYLGMTVSGREQELEELGEGSTGQTELSRARLAQLPLLLPPSALQQKFDRIVFPLIRRRLANEDEVETLAATRDLLLPRLMSGELRIRDAEKIAEDAA